MIYREALRHEYEEPKQWEIKEINSIMNTCIAGWEKISSHRFDRYGLQRGWKRETDTQGFTTLPDNVQLPFK